MGVLYCTKIIQQTYVLSTWTILQNKINNQNDDND